MAWDAVGNLIEKRDRSAPGGDRDILERYRHDGLNRLDTVHQDGVLTLGYAL